jgi:hypothetical protein
MARMGKRREVEFEVVSLGRVLNFCENAALLEVDHDDS